MRFTKMQGAGNDFVIINNIEEKLPHESFPTIARAVCRRRLSIGADGLMVVERAESTGDFRMLFYNSDGSVGEMCGNGARCIARYGFENGLSSGDVQVVETTSGIVTGKRVSKRMYTVRLSDPTVTELNMPVDVLGKEYICSYLELGSPGLPHAIVILDGWQDVDERVLKETGRAIRNFDGFPKGANVTFCEIVGKDHVAAKTFERGVEDFTLACGTGCGSTVAALTLLGLVSGENVKVSMPGGDLFVSVTIDGGAARDIYLTGPTNVVAEGEIKDEDLSI